MKIKVLKKNQIVIFVIALMLMAAGYLSYTTNEQYGSIGDARLVSSNGIVEDQNITENIEQEITQQTTNNIEVENTKEESINTVNTNAKITNDQYFSSSRLNRDTMYSQMIASYEKILESQTIPSDQKSIAQTEIKNINDLKNSIMICENLIKTKGFEDVIIFVNNDSINIIIKIQELSQEQIAQIQNIVSRELKADILNIHISNKY